MPEVNTVPFKYDPVQGGLYLEQFRSNFYLERLGDVKDTLQYLDFTFENVHLIRGALFFTDAEGEPPIIRDIHYDRVQDRGERGRPYDKRCVELWPK